MNNIKNQLVLSSGIQSNNVKYPQKEVDKMKLPVIIPVTYKNKFVGIAKNFVKKNHKVYCHIDLKLSETVLKNSEIGATTIGVQDIKQKKGYVKATGLEFIKLSVVPKYCK